MLESVNFDPLRAQLLMDDEGPPLKAIWWARYAIDRKYRAEAQKSK